MESKSLLIVFVCFILTKQNKTKNIDKEHDENLYM